MTMFPLYFFAFMVYLCELHLTTKRLKDKIPIDILLTTSTKSWFYVVFGLPHDNFHKTHMLKFHLNAILFLIMLFIIHFSFFW